MTQVTCTTPAVFCSCFCCKLQEHVYTTHLISALLLTGNSFRHLRQPDGPNFYVAVLLESDSLQGVPSSFSLQESIPYC